MTDFKVPYSGRNLDVKLSVSGSANAPLVILNAFGDEGFKTYEKLASMTKKPYSLAVISDLDWDCDMSPWEAPSAMKGQSFPGGADAYLNALEKRILPEILTRIDSHIDSEPVYKAIAGYSLAGLFALYSLYRTDVFSRVASVSASMWYPGFIEFAKRNKMIRKPDRVYLSLGDGEAKTRHPLLSKVQENTESYYEYLKENGIECFYEINQGNHFKDAELRTSKGICRILEA
ncbi:MAG: alpha/beta hydrolase [Sphaerochaeta sp.]